MRLSGVPWERRNTEILSEAQNDDQISNRKGKGKGKGNGNGKDNSKGNAVGSGLVRTAPQIPGRYG
jgi:hypothetical protein